MAKLYIRLLAIAKQAMSSKKEKASTPEGALAVVGLVVASQAATGALALALAIPV